MASTSVAIEPEGQSFRASFRGSALFLILSLLTTIWCVLVIAFNDAPQEMELIAWLLIFGCVIMGVVMFYRMIWRPVIIHVGSAGIYLKNYGATIPWEALEGVRLATVRLGHDDEPGGGKQLVEFVAKSPLHPAMITGRLRAGRSANLMAGLPDYCMSMDGLEGSNAMLLAALTAYVPILPPSKN